jgi:dipicolinate synthase subunit A
MDWNKVSIAIVGGDRREQEIARCAAETGASIRAYGFPWPDEGISGVVHESNASDCFEKADFALFPIPGIAPDGALFAPQCPDRIIPDEAMLSRMKPSANIILGWADTHLKRRCDSLGIALHEYEWDVDLMLLRAPAIIEGMLKVIIENTNFTIHKAKVCLVGQGTIGTLATSRLYGLGAHVHVVARNAVQRAAAYAAGAEAHSFGDLRTVLRDTDIVISSVPAQIIKEADLAVLPKHALLVDLAAPPGGIDRDAASALRLKFVWARGLGSRAPVTVGRSQWGGIRRRIEEIVAAQPISG